MNIIKTLLTMLFLLSFCFAEKQFLMKIGPAWPSALWDTEKPTAWDASIQTGAVIDKKVAIGGAVDFLWNRDAKENNKGNGVYEIDVTQRTFMFPLSLYLSISPVPDLFLQPCITGSVGLNTMYFSYEGDGTDTTNINSSSRKFDGNGWYMGVIWKIAADAVMRLGDNSGLFAGLEYQWSKPRKMGSSGGNLYLRRNMSGMGIRMGIKVSY